MTLLSWTYKNNTRDRATVVHSFLPGIRGNMNKIISLNQDDKTISIFKNNLCETKSMKSNNWQVWLLVALAIFQPYEL